MVSSVSVRASTHHEPNSLTSPSKHAYSPRQWVAPKFSNHRCDVEGEEVSPSGVTTLTATMIKALTPGCTTFVAHAINECCEMLLQCEYLSN